MSTASVVSIFITSGPAAAMRSVAQVRAVAGQGLEGDRYFRGAGTFSKDAGPDQEVTLVESEAVEALRRDYGVEIGPEQTRRNILTRGTSLNHLVGREFRVGDVRLRGLRLCEPCGHLEKLTREGVKKGLVHRGGLRAQILNDGVIRVGDAVSMTP